MSQYQPPYQQPPYVPPSVPPYYGPPADLLRAARRAGLLMFVIGGLLLLLCLINTIGLAGTSAAELVKQYQQMPGAAQSLPMSADQLKASYIGFLIFFLILSLGFSALGAGVRAGGKFSTITAILMTGIALVGTGLCFLVMAALGTQSPVAIGAACTLVIPLALFSWLMIWLVPAVRALSGLSAAQQQQQAQYWQYQQTMQAYMMQGQQPSMGYPTAPPPPPPPLSTPPGDPSKSG